MTSLHSCEKILNCRIFGKHRKPHRVFGGKYHFRHLVDIEIYSFDFHMTKPERLFGEAMIAKTSARLGEIVYIDDNDSYGQSPHRIWRCVVIRGRGNTAGRRAALRQYGVEC